MAIKTTKKARPDDDDDDLDFEPEALDGDEADEVEEVEEEDDAPVAKKKVKRNREEEVEPDEEDEEKPSKKTSATSKVAKGGGKVKTQKEKAKKAPAKIKTKSIPRSEWTTPYRPGSFSETIFKKAQEGIKVSKIHAYGKEHEANAGAVYRLVKQLRSGEQNGRRWTVDEEKGFIQLTLKKAAAPVAKQQKKAA